jgi:hypothetical protein
MTKALCAQWWRLEECNFHITSPQPLDKSVCVCVEMRRANKIWNEEKNAGKQNYVIIIF